MEVGLQGGDDPMNGLNHGEANVTSKVEIFQESKSTTTLKSTLVHNMKYSIFFDHSHPFNLCLQMQNLSVVIHDY